jgi:hypothetical protein
MHPNEYQLALYAGGELGPLERWRTGLHVRGCEHCQKESLALQKTSNELRLLQDEMPKVLNWKRLAAEMTGNIRVGLAAGECVASVGAKPERMGWRAATVLASATALMMTAWWLNIPPSKGRPVAGSNLVRLEANSSGIEVKQNGGALMLLNPARASNSAVFLSVPGSLRARYVDSETGQVTINYVYAQ